MNDYTLADIAVGMTEQFVVTVTDESREQFAALSGDVNPLHVDPQYARDRGFPSRVVHGMLTSSFYSTLVGMYMPGKHCLLQGIKIGFHHPVFAGDQLTIRGEVTHVSEAARVITVQGSITNQHGAVVSKAQVQVGFQ